MNARKWKDGDEAVIMQWDGHKHQSIRGTIHSLLDRPGRWWFIPAGGRVLHGDSFAESELRRP